MAVGTAWEKKGLRVGWISEIPALEIFLLAGKLSSSLWKEAGLFCIVWERMLRHNPKNGAVLCA
jgi:hypothetical protein